MPHLAVDKAHCVDQNTDARNDARFEKWLSSKMLEAATGSVICFNDNTPERIHATSYEVHFMFRKLSQTAFVLFFPLIMLSAQILI